ncbi:beta-glucosidase BglX [soil metagenome]
MSSTPASAVESTTSPTAWTVSPAIEENVTALIDRMTLEEKLGQLTQFASGIVTGPTGEKIDERELAATGRLGSVLNLTGAAQVNALQREAVEKSRLKIPILFAMDIIHGYRTTYPVPLALAAAWDPDLAADCAHMAAVEGTAAGIRWTFSPMVDIARDARWGRIVEGNGEDPYLGEVFARAWVRGYQGDDLTAPTAMLACAKHFVGYGAAEGGRDYNTVDLSDRVLRDIYLPPFKAALDQGVGTMMSAFNSLQGVPASADRRTLTDILRAEWGFRGFVVSDWNSIGELIAHGVALNGLQAGFKALDAGVDMDMQANLYPRLGELVKNGTLKIEVIDEAVRRVLRVKFAIGLFDRPYTDESLAPAAYLTPEHLALARRAAEDSFVLLKNEPIAGGSSLLPLKEGGTVALIGALADSKDDMLGAWSSHGQQHDVVTLREALAERLHDKLIYARGVGPAGDSAEDFPDAMNAAARADLVVLALGESRDMSGEAASRSRLDLPGRQLELLKKIVETGKPVVLVLFNGRPLSLPWEAAHVPAILEAWYPGIQAGPALVRTLFGEANPSGKLTASFPRSLGQIPLYYNYFNTGRPSPGADRYVTGYIDDEHTPLFPFGWGLSYTKFEYSPTHLLTPKATAAEINAGGSIEVEATIKNAGLVAGRETVQLYIRERGTSVVRPVRELKAFQKISLQPGEARTVKFKLAKKDLSFWNIDMQEKVEPCELTIWIAPNSQAGESTKMLIE